MAKLQTEVAACDAEIAALEAKELARPEPGSMQAAVKLRLQALAELPAGQTELVQQQQGMHEQVVAQMASMDLMLTQMAQLRERAIAAAKPPDPAAQAAAAKPAAPVPSKDVPEVAEPMEWDSLDADTQEMVAQEAQERRCCSAADFKENDQLRSDGMVGLLAHADRAKKARVSSYG